VRDAERAVLATIRRLEREDGAIHSALDALRYLAGTLARFPRIRVSRRESAVIEMIVEGRSDKEIAAAWGIGVSAAKKYVSALLVRYGARGRANLAARFLRLAS
jgi:DNA-binding NarL/FixJ family response regulator